MHYLGIQVCNTLLNTIREMVNMTVIHSCLGLVDVFQYHYIDLG